MKKICLLLFISLLFSFCKKENTAVLPIITTVDVTNITDTTAVSGGDIYIDGAAEITVSGVCWNTNPNPTTADKKTIDGTNKGKFSTKLTELSGSTEYFVRAYATNSVGTSYGNEKQFTTSVHIKLATLNTLDPHQITATTAKSGGWVTDEGGGSITKCGVCWAKTPSPTVLNSKTSDTYDLNFGDFTSLITGLSANTLYYVRAYATTSAGVSYGHEVQFTTLPN